MVGSCYFSYYGEYWGWYFVLELVFIGLVIISGLVMGIDGICYKVVLNIRGKIIVVLGSGLENIYLCCYS